MFNLNGTYSVKGNIVSMKLYDVDGVHDTTTESKIVLSNDILSFYYNVTDDYVEDYLSSDNEAFVVSSVIVAGYFKRVN